MTGFLALSAPVGSRAFTTNNFAITPTIAAGKGWGNFDMQLTFSSTFPTGDVHTLGTPLLTHITFQYHLLELLWPEVEVNYTYWPNGANRGKNQVFITSGVVLGRIPAIRKTNAHCGNGLPICRQRPSPTVRKQLDFVRPHKFLSANLSSHEPIEVSPVSNE